jgi:predicted transcriptional regulator
MKKKPNLKEMIRFRLSAGLKRRTQRVAQRRECADSDIAREGLMNFLAEEEKRLGLVPMK